MHEMSITFCRSLFIKERGSVMAGGHGEQYADLTLHRPKWWQRAVGKGLCTIMWLWMMYRARKDGPVVMGWRHPWDGHGHGHGHRGGHGGAGLAELHVQEEEEEEEETFHAFHSSVESIRKHSMPEVEIEAMPMKKDHHKDNHEAMKSPMKKDHHKDHHEEMKAPIFFAIPSKSKNLQTYDLSDSKDRQKAVKDALYAALRDGDHEQLESAIRSRAHESRSSNKVSDAGPKDQQQLRKKATPLPKEQHAGPKDQQQLSKKAIPLPKEQHAGPKDQQQSSKKAIPLPKEQHAGPKDQQQSPRKVIPLSKEQLRKAIEDHPKLLSLLKDDE